MMEYHRPYLLPKDTAVQANARGITKVYWCACVTMQTVPTQTQGLMAAPLQSWRDEPVVADEQRQVSVVCMLEREREREKIRKGRGHRG